MQINGIKVRFNWADNSFDYVIRDFEGKIDYSLDIIRQTYLLAENVVIELPNHGWKVYSGKVEDIAEIYEAIYKEGVLDYEIEEFDDMGNCKISILRL